MHKDGLGSEEATKAAQALRPIINPIGQLPLLLRRFEALRAETHRRVWAEAEEARQAQELRQKDGKSRAAAHSQAHQQAHQRPQQQLKAGGALDDCIEALHFIGRKADHLFVFAHEVHEAILVANDELPAGKRRARTNSNTRVARAVIDEADEEDYDEEDDDDYDDDFEELIRTTITMTTTTTRRRRRRTSRIHPASRWRVVSLPPRQSSSRRRRRKSGRPIAAPQHRMRRISPHYGGLSRSRALPFAMWRRGCTRRRRRSPQGTLPSLPLARRST